jgi:DNA-binding transcriptional LysR family regulator
MRHYDKYHCMKFKKTNPSFSPTDLRLLRIFLAVVRHEGFASAQNELGISPGTISNHIAQLEARFGVRLCERGRKGFSLTEEGVQIHEAAESLLRSVDNFSGIVGSVRGELTGTVHFGTVDAMYTNTELKLDRALARFNELAPRVQIHLDIASPQDLQQRLLDGRYSLILTPIDEPHPSVEATPLFEEQQVLCCGSQHQLFSVNDNALTIDELQAHPYAARTYMKENAGPTSLSFQNAALTSHMESLAILILSGRYIGYLPSHFAAPFMERGEMKSLLPKLTSYFDKFFLAHRRDERSRTMILLADCLSMVLPNG